jgi:hypothetical protein
MAKVQNNFEATKGFSNFFQKKLALLSQAMPTQTT